MNDHHQLQLEIPQFVYSSAPTLVPGGGAEVIPIANQQWFTNNGFTPSFSAPHTPFCNETQEQPVDQRSAPFDFAAEVPFPPPALPSPPDLRLLASTSLSAPSALGLPVYSASGFDLLSVLARVANRPHPRVLLGPVDLSCAFVVADVRRFDHPIIYCSPSFCTLTGYSEAEVLGRNCRFLQAPGGNVAKGDQRTYTSTESVAHLRKSLLADKECQASVVNYKKNCAAFINLVTVIPVTGDDDSNIVYHVGFQIDLTEQPNAILEKLRDGSYVVGHEAANILAGRPTQIAPQNAQGRDRKTHVIQPIAMSKHLKRLLADPAFLRSFPLPPVPTSSGSASSHAQTSSSLDPASNHGHLLHLFLLETTPDFVHVVSLKGSFLYVAPSVRRVLGYDADELMGGSIADYAHPEDVVPLMRELKESSATGVATTAEVPTVDPSTPLPRSVDLLFRARTKMGRYVWIESRGRLHVEPGKGRKAIILSGRAREMMSLRWEDVRRTGGLAVPLRRAQKEVATETWGLLTGTSLQTLAFSCVSPSTMPDVLGWGAHELLGGGVDAYVLDDGKCLMEIARVVEGMVAWVAWMRGAGVAPPDYGSLRYKKLRLGLRKKDGGVADVWFMLYRADKDEDWVCHCPAGEGNCAGDNDAMMVDGDATTSRKRYRPHRRPQPYQDAAARKRGVGRSIAPAAFVFQIRLVGAETVDCGPSTILPALDPVPALSPSLAPSSSKASPSSSSTSTAPALDMFDELHISRGSSWQYELQQLKFANTRLLEEVATLEAAEAAREQGGSKRKQKEEEKSSSQAAAEEEQQGMGQYMQISGYGYEPFDPYEGVGMGSDEGGAPFVFDAPAPQSLPQRSGSTSAAAPFVYEQQRGLYSPSFPPLPVFPLQPRYSRPQQPQHQLYQHQQPTFFNPDVLSASGHHLTSSSNQPTSPQDKAYPPPTSQSPPLHQPQPQAKFTLQGFSPPPPVLASASELHLQRRLSRAGGVDVERLPVQHTQHQDWGTAPNYTHHAQAPTHAYALPVSSMSPPQLSAVAYSQVYGHPPPASGSGNALKRPWSDVDSR